MDTTFISIHGDVLGYHPEEVIGKSCWDYFHPDEIPFAKALHGRGVELDKAAVLNYCRIKGKDGVWVGCECCFTVVHNVLVGCTSTYRPNAKSKQRAANAPIIRQIFSSSPRDPRYNMLSYISSKFSDGPRPHLREPRAALFLNRFTRTLTIMYATNGLEPLLGVSSAELTGKSFYFCIQEQCLPEAIRCLESAKANDSIAYLRFWYRDPRKDDGSDPDERMSNAASSEQSSDEDDGGVHLQPLHKQEGSGSGSEASVGHHSVSSMSNSIGEGATPQGVPVPSDIHSPSKFSSSGRGLSSTDTNMDPVFDRSRERLNVESSHTSVSPNGGDSRRQDRSSADMCSQPAIELEAVVSCTSDGLVVVLRAARPFVPDSIRPAPPSRLPNAPTFTKGLFASPWATQPVLPQQLPPNAQPPQSIISDTSATGPVPAPVAGLDTPAAIGAVAGGSYAAPAFGDLMTTIREAVVFAWALTGINGSLAQYGRGNPSMGAQPPGGLPVWQGDAGPMDIDGDMMVGKLMLEKFMSSGRSFEDLENMH